MSKTNSSQPNPIVVIFSIQLALLLIMVVLFFLGLNNIMTLGGFWFAVIMGALGASVGLMRNRKVLSEGSFNGANRIVISTMMPILYGTIMAGVTYLIFMSHILSGDGGGGLITTNIFPNFTNIGISSQSINIADLIGLIDSTQSIKMTDLIDLAASTNITSETSGIASEQNMMERFVNITTETITDTGKLLVWCFIAGYSENFITGVLSNMESRVFQKEKAEETKAD